MVEKVREASLQSSDSGPRCGIGVEIRTVTIDRVNLRIGGVMAAELSGIEQLLASRIGLDPVSVGSPLIFAQHGSE